MVPARDDDRGASLVEYALLLVLIAVVCVVGITVLGETTNEGFSSGADMFP
jgi:Flp pilus assembly pilin Flp